MSMMGDGVEQRGGRGSEMDEQRTAADLRRSGSESFKREAGEIESPDSAPPFGSLDSGLLKAGIQDAIKQHLARKSPRSRCTSMKFNEIRAPKDVVEATYARLKDQHLENYSAFFHEKYGQPGTLEHVTDVPPMASTSSMERGNLILNSFREEPDRQAVVVWEGFIADVPEGYSTDEFLESLKTIRDSNIESLTTEAEDVRKRRGFDLNELPGDENSTEEATN